MFHAFILQNVRLDDPMNPHGIKIYVSTTY